MDKWTDGEAVSPKQESKKPSRWWMLYHLWAGICVKVYVDLSGLSSASSYGDTAAMVAVGSVALGYFLSKRLTNVIDRNTMPRKGRIALKSILPVIYFVAAMLLSAVTAPLLAMSKSVQKSLAPIGQQSELKPVMAFTTTQSAEGVTESDLDQADLKNLETWIVETMLQKGENSFAERGFNPKDFKPKVSATSVYVNVGGKKLAVIRVNTDSMIRSVTVMGIKGAELLRVSCIRASNHDIPVLHGECGNEVRKSFGVSIQP